MCSLDGRSRIDTDAIPGRVKQAGNKTASASPLWNTDAVVSFAYVASPTEARDARDG